MKIMLEGINRRLGEAPAPDRALTAGSRGGRFGALTMPGRGVLSAGHCGWLGQGPGSRRRGPRAVTHSHLPAAWHPLCRPPTSTGPQGAAASPVFRRL